jgi:hypothetical protein
MGVACGIATCGFSTWLDPFADEEVHIARPSRPRRAPGRPPLTGAPSDELVPITRHTQ